MGCLGRVGDTVGAVVAGSVAALVGSGIWRGQDAMYATCANIVNTCLPRNLFNDRLVNGLCSDWVDLNTLPRETVNTLFGIGTAVTFITGVTAIYLACRAFGCCSAQGRQNLKGRVEPQNTPNKKAQ